MEKDKLKKIVDILIQKEDITSTDVKLCVSNLINPILEKRLTNHFMSKLDYRQYESYYSTRRSKNSIPTDPNLMEQIEKLNLRQDVARKLYLENNGRYISEAAIMQYQKEMKQLDQIVSPVVLYSNKLIPQTKSLFRNQKIRSKFIDDIIEGNIISVPKMIKDSIDHNHPSKVININNYINSELLLSNKALKRYFIVDYKPSEGGGTTSVGPLEYFLILFDKNTYSTRVKNFDSKKHKGDVVVNVDNELKSLELKSSGGGLGRSRFFGNYHYVCDELFNIVNEIKLLTKTKTIVEYDRKQLFLTEKGISNEESSIGFNNLFNLVVQYPETTIRGYSTHSIEFFGNILNTFFDAMVTNDVHSIFDKRQNNYLDLTNCLTYNNGIEIDFDEFQRLFNSNVFEYYQLSHNFHYLGLYDKSSDNIVFFENSKQFYKTAKLGHISFDGVYSNTGAGDRYLVATSRIYLNK